MNGTQATRQARPPPTGPAPPAPVTAPPAPPVNTGAPPPAVRQPNGPANGAHTHTAASAAAQKAKKKNPDPPVDPSQLYESLKNRIATLEEEEIHNEEEERKIGAHLTTH